MGIRTAGLAMALGLALAGCSASEATEESPNVARWKAGTAVAVVLADVRAGEPDVAQLGKEPGVIAASLSGTTLKVVFGRQAMLADVAALEHRLADTPGLVEVRTTLVAP